MLQSLTLSPIRGVSVNGGMSSRHGTWYDLWNGIIIGNVMYAFAKTLFQVQFISFSHSAYITSRIIMPFRKLIPPFYSHRFSSYPTHYFIATVCKLNASPTTILEACFGWFRPLIRLKFWASPFSSFWSLHFHHIAFYCKLLRRTCIEKGTIR